jgi:hypothetical protein
MYCTLRSVKFTQKMAVIQCTPVPAVQNLKYQEQNGGGELDVRETQDNFGVVLSLKHSAEPLIVIFKAQDFCQWYEDLAI